MRVITIGGTARVELDRKASGTQDVGAVVAGVQHCADEGVEELVITVPELEQGWLEILEKALLATPDTLRISVAVGDPGPDRTRANQAER